MKIEWFDHEVYFLMPIYLWLLVPIALFSIYLAFQSHRENIGQNVIAPHILKLLIVKSNNKRNLVTPNAVILTIMLLLTLVLSRPSWQPKSNVYYDNAPIFVVLDLSVSMDKNDIKPTRLQKAKLLISDLLRGKLTRPVSIVAFSGSSHQLIPFTDDSEMSLLYLSYLAPSVMPKPGGNSGALIELLQKSAPIGAKQVDLLFLTDGDVDDTASLKKFLNGNQIKTHVLYLSDMGEQVAEQLGADKYDGRSARLNTAKLKEVLFEIDDKGSNDGGGLVDESHWLLLITVVLASLWFRKGWTLHFSLIFSLVLTYSPNADASFKDIFLTKDQQAMIYMYQGDYKSAEALFQDPAWLAVSCYYQEKFECAEANFIKVGTVEGTYNAADSLAQRGIYKKAKSYYDAVLGIEPDNKKAQKNLKIVNEIIKKIDRLSNSYDDERPPEKNESKPPKDENEIANGKKQKIIGRRPVSSMKENEVLENKAATEKWLRDISKNPQDFIRRKFLNEYNQSNNNE